MLLVREFESMLASIKASGAYRGFAYAYRGSAHHSVGQEAVAVGAALALEPDDHIYGTHRSHGEFLSVGLAAIAKLPAAQSAAVLAEIFMRADGFNGRIGGSMHAVFPRSAPIQTMP